MIFEEQVRKLAEERMEELGNGLYIVELKIRSGNRIHIEIDRETGSVSIEDCMSVSRNVEHNLDREVEDFSIDVSSAGLDKPLRAIKQYLKHVGRQVKVTTENGEKTIEGLMKFADDQGIVIETKDKEREEGKKPVRTGHPGGKKVWVTREFPLKYSEINETKLVITF